MSLAAPQGYFQKKRDADRTFLRFDPCFEDQKEDQTMADCGDMKKGDVFFCKNCGLELEVTKSCSCGTGGQSGSCTVPLQCCGGDMQKKR